MNCEHQNKELRYMHHCGQVRFQCIDCGNSVGNAIKHSELNGINPLSLPHFDQVLRETKWQEKHKQYVEDKPQREALNARKREVYLNYLQSPQWKEKRRLVIERENNLCQGCRAAPIKDIHHATYNTLGDELLFELVGLCRDCHEKTHHIKPA